MKHYGNSTRSGRARRRRFHGENFLVTRGSIFRCGTRALRPARRLAARLIVIESFRLFPHDPAPDETLERTQRPLIFRRNKADRVPNGVRAACASDAMDIILRMHREIVVHHMRDPVHIDAAGGDVGRHQHPHRAGLEILQRAQPLILGTIGMDGAGFDSAALQPTRDPIGAVLRPGKNKNRIEFWIA